MKRALRTLKRTRREQDRSEARRAASSFVNAKDVKGVRGHDLRTQTLGQEFAARGKAGGFKDLREGGDGQDVALARMQKVRGRQREKDKFRLSDEPASGLTHGGRPLSEIVHREARAPIEEDGEQAAKRRRKEDRFEEIIEKSREHREEKSREHAERDKDLMAVDEDWKEISQLLPRQRSAKTSAALSKAAPAPASDKKPRVLTLGASGDVVSNDFNKSAGLSKKPKLVPVDDDARKNMQALLERIRAEDPAQQAATEGEADQQTPLDPYDSLFLTLQQSSGAAHAGARSKTDEELAKEAKLQLRRLQKEKTDRMKQDGEEPDDDNDDTERVPTTVDGKVDKAKRDAEKLFEGFLEELEDECRVRDGKTKISFERVDSIANQLHRLTRVNPLAASSTARGVLQALHDLLQQDLARGSMKSDAARQSASPFSLVAPAVFCRVFPLSDFRHPVSTPLILLILSCLVQTPIDSVRTVACGLWRVALLVDGLADSGRYSGELLVYLANVLSLTCEDDAHTPEAVKRYTAAEQAERAARAAAAAEEEEEDEEDEEEEEDEEDEEGEEGMEEDGAEARAAELIPSRADNRTNRVLAPNLPQLPAASTGMLAPPRSAPAKLPQPTPVDFAAVLAADTADDSPQLRCNLVAAALRLLHRLVQRWGEQPFAEPCFAPVLRTLDRIKVAAPAWVGEGGPMADLFATVSSATRGAVTGAAASRAPLLLQSHRPIPLPLFPCKVTEWGEDQEDEKKALKREFRAEMKKVKRELRADSRFLAVAREQEQAEASQKREDTLKGLMVEMNEQRKMTKDSDFAKARLKAIQKKGKKR